MGNARNGDTGRAHRNPAFSSFAEQDEHAIDEVVARFGELIRIDLVSQSRLRDGSQLRVIRQLSQFEYLSYRRRGPSNKQAEHC